MYTRIPTAALPAALAALITIAGCARKEAESPAAPPPPPAATAPAATPQPAPAADTTAAAAAPATTAATPTAAASDNAAGQKVFKMYCETCHGAGGHGDGPASLALNPKPANFAAGAFKYDVNGNGIKGDIDDIKAIVHDGAAKHGGSPLMTPWMMLKPDQLQAVAQYVKSFHTG
ncbi:MAG: cytochrome c [Gammaproteobacteria bacterium]|nr:cytochrome c [Gammaproteobacteria bacterium]